MFLAKVKPRLSISLHTFVHMKNLITSYRLWRYRRLYRKLFWIYVEKSSTACVAKSNADIAFELLTGYSSDCVSFPH